MYGEIAQIGKPKTKYQQGYEYLAETIFSLEGIDTETRMEISEGLDDIFGIRRKC